MPPHCTSGVVPNLSLRKVLALAMALTLTALASCSPSPKAGGGIGGTGSVSSVSSGTVTKLGSVSVSGTQYDNSNALYCLDGEPCSTENSLKLGMVVLVKGTALSPPEGSVTRVADTIIYEETVEGVVQSVAPDGSSLVILGQFVVVNQKTVIDESIPGRSVRNLKPGVDLIQVSGLVAGDGNILATLVMRRTGTLHYEVQGIIRNHDARGKRFEIGQLVVDYSSADVSDITAGDTMNWNDRLVHVRGDEWQPRSEVPYGATLRATRVNGLGLMVEDSAEANIEGFITSMTQSGALTINNHPINVSSSTTFEGGTANELVLGKHVSIHGTLDAGSVGCSEDHLQRKPSDGVERRIDRPSSPYSNPSRVFLECPLNPTCSNSDRRRRHRHPLRGYPNRRPSENPREDFLTADRTLATELERTEPSAVIVLEAPLQSAVDPQISMAGVSIDTSGLSDNEFIGNYGPIGRSTFFENALIGQPVWGERNA